MSRKFDIYKIVKIGLKAMKRAKNQIYWRKYSRKDYTKHLSFHVFWKMQLAPLMRNIYIYI